MRWPFPPSAKMESGDVLECMERISVAAPGGDFRLDDNGGGGVIGPGWNFALGSDVLVRIRDLGVRAVRIRNRRADSGTNAGPDPDALRHGSSSSPRVLPAVRAATVRLGDRGRLQQPHTDEWSGAPDLSRACSTPRAD